MQSAPLPIPTPRLRWISFPALALTLMSCTGAIDDHLECPDLAAVGIQVTVRDAHDHRPVCDAQVQAGDGEYTETLTTWDTGQACSYAGAFNRPGEYQIDVVHPDFDVASTTATVTSTGPCPSEIETAHVTLELTPIEQALHGGGRAILAVANRFPQK